MADRAIYPPSHAEAFKAHAGESYRPSNGTEGEYFEAAWCRNCRRDTTPDGNGCLINLSAFAFDVGEPDYPSEWQHGEDGQPVCTAFSDKHAPRPAYRCKVTDDLFAHPEAAATAMMEEG